jgi:hypothetical protein
MIRPRTLVIFLSTLSIIVSSPTKVRSQKPTFEKYSVVESFTGKPASVDLKSHPKAHLFRTAIRRGSRRGPNFAGHFTIVEMGCGTGCTVIAVVDAINGKVVFPEEVNPIGFVGTSPRYGLVYRTDSNLFIVNGTPSSKTNDGSYYYLWKDGKLNLVYAQVWEKEGRP